MAKAKSARPRTEPTPEQRKLGERIQKLRAGRDVTQEVLAAEIGISQKYLSELERGTKTPSWATLIAIAHKGFGIKLAALMFGIDDDAATEIQALTDVLAGRSKEARANLLRAVDLLLRIGEPSS
jgi:transcriptional regulator with XRE-family HTH domain